MSSHMRARFWLEVGGAVTVVVGLFLDRYLKYQAWSQRSAAPQSLVPGIETGFFPNPTLFFLPVWSGWRFVSLGVLSSLVLFYIVRVVQGKYHESPYTPYASLGWLLILAGGFSNVWDRWSYGGVIDIVYILGIATFNLADILILMGLLFLMFPNYIKRIV